MKPAFTPKSGIGAVWKDKNGKAWKFTPQGWIESGAPDIKQDVKQRGTFDVGTNDVETVSLGTDDEFITWAKANGASQEQVNTGLTESRRIRKNIEATGGIIGEPAQENVQEGADTSNPFFDSKLGRLMTKQEVTLDAYNQGIKDVDELEKIEKLYDKLTVEEENIPGEEDLAALSYEKQLEVKDQIKSLALEKASAFETKEEREAVMSALSTFDTAQELIDILEDEKVSTGLGAVVRRGIFGIGTRRLGMTTEEENNFNARAEDLAAIYRKAFSGTAVSEPEMKRLEQFLPSETKSKEDNIAGLKAITDRLAREQSLRVGFDLSPLKPRTTNKDPLKILEIGKVSKNNPLGI